MWYNSACINNTVHTKARQVTPVIMKSNKMQNPQRIYTASLALYANAHAWKLATPHVVAVTDYICT